MVHLVGFRTSRFDVSTETPNPINPIAGQSVLGWLRGELEKARYASTDPATEDWGWYIDVKGAEDKVLGRNKLAADDPVVALIERLVRADPEIADVSVDRAP